MASITLADVSIQFPLYQGSSRSLKKTLLSMANVRSLTRDHNRILVRALQDVSLHIAHGDRVGLVGHNGAGKTTLLRVLAGVYEPTVGCIEVAGAVSALLDVNLGLNMDATGWENIFLRGLYLGLRPPEIRRLAPGIAEFTELGEFLYMPVRTYSAGMILRLAFAVATAAKPQILLMDEWLLAGDANFLSKAHARIESFVRQSEILVLASHSLPILEEWCTKIVWLDTGRVVMVGDPASVLRRYTEAREEAVAEGQ
jgi:ABC-2 type transport system ATP-binding protein/lipopolysaccharide transport system ATP-binding protein